MSTNHSPDFELRHWRSPSLNHRHHHHPPLTITIPNGNNHSNYSHSNHDDGNKYVSLRDILTSPDFVRVQPSPVAARGSCPEINIKNPLVKHAAYAYLQPNNSARGNAGRRRRLSARRVCAEIFSPCLEFLGVIFNFRR